MATLARKSIPLCTFALGIALGLAPIARAGDVTVQLDAGAGLSVRNSTGAIQRLRVDEATGNLSRNGALFVHTTGLNGTFVGVAAGNTSMTGGQNSAFGSAALRVNTTGSGNSAVGFYALRNNTTGDTNSAFGLYALRSNTTGIANSAFGSDALRSSTAVHGNSAFGASALRYNTTGYLNSAFGAAALAYNTTGNSNSAFGLDALRSNSSGDGNAAFGGSALGDNITGDFNSAFGVDALRSNATGVGNTAVGFEALGAATAQHFNTALGRQALAQLTNGTGNVAIGVGAGSSLTAGTHNIYIATGGPSSEDGWIRIGNPTDNTKTQIAGIRAVTTLNANAIPVLIDSSHQLGTVSSSRRAKKDIRDMGDATARLLELRPVTFRYKQEQTLPSGEVPPAYGLIAEEVAEIFPDLVVYDDAGQPFTVKYHEMAPMLLNEMQKQQRTIEAQRLEMRTQQQTQDEKLKAQQQQIAALTQRLALLERTPGSAAAPEGVTR